MKSRTINMMQTLFDGEFGLFKIPTTIVKEAHLDAEVLSGFDHVLPIGISPGYSSSGKLNAIAIADDQHCVIVELNVADPRRGRSNNTPPNRNDEGLKLLQQILCRTAGDLIAFDMGPLTMSLYCDANRLRVHNAVDVQSGLSAIEGQSGKPIIDEISIVDRRKPLTIIKAILGTAVPIKETNVVNIFRYPEYQTNDRNVSAGELAMRAWVSQVLSSYGNGAETLAKVPRISTSDLKDEELAMISKLANDSLRLDQLKPGQAKHGFTRIMTRADGDLSTADASTYKDKFRAGQRVKAVVQGPGNSEYVVRGSVDAVVGKSGVLNTNRSLENKTIKSITSIGRDDPTTAEVHRAATILRILQGSISLLSESPWINNIWFPSSDGSLVWPDDWTESLLPPPSPATQSDLSAHNNVVPVVHHQLNDSQQEAVNTMYSPLNCHRITIIQGPPGTGKTSVIASFVQIAIQTGYNGIWLVAQSNVAVKNIAEKLVDVGFLDWKILVSKDFHFEWHEHIYTKIKERVITSNYFFGYKASHLRGCRVILCTLSMLSNNLITKFTQTIPVKILVVDEASQIEVGNYISVFSKFESTLRKACFIGDDKQLPPFGQEDLQDLQSIFEISHLRQYALFLDTQYRMPPQIGQIISEAVYNGKLKSNPLHPVTKKSIACYFIDISGQEKRQGDSFMNLSECNAVIQLAEKLQEQQKFYQIITPYEGQRAIIEQEMKANGLRWENKCFNVDSFQGNEQDYIIISLVRSWELGFLTNLRRTNVMLTRCKKGMFIISSQKFLSGKGSDTLVGTLLKKMGTESWLDMKAVEKGNF